MVKPLTVQDCETVADGGVVLLATVQVEFAAELTVEAEATVYVEATPSAVKVTRTAPVPAKATVGVAKGVVPGASDADASETVEAVEPPVGVTVNVYDVPFVSPVTVQLWAPEGTVTELATVQVELPGVEVTVYSVATPSATKLTLMAPVPAFATVGVGSAVVGVSEAEAAEIVDVVPFPEGVTVKVYGVPFVSPEMEQLCAPVGIVVVLATVQVTVPGDEVTVYSDATPSATNETTTLPGPAFATVGAARAVPGVSEADRAEAISVSPPPLGVTVNSYAVAEASPVTVQFCEPVGAVVAVTVHVGPAVANDEPLYAVTVYVVATPSAVKVTFTDVLLAIATVGVARATNVLIDAEAADTVDVVELPVGVTVKV